MKKLILASALTLICTGSAFAADSFSFGISLRIPVTPSYVAWDGGYPVTREYRPVIVRHDGYRHRHDLNRNCRLVREEYYDRGRVVTSRTRTVCDKRHDGWRRDGRHHDRY